MRKAIYLLFFLVWLCPAACMAQGLHFGLKAGVLGNKADIQGRQCRYQDTKYRHTHRIKMGNGVVRQL